MSKTRFTKGQIKVVGKNYLRLGRRNIGVASVTPETPRPVAEANTLLWSAAPDLYAALEGLHIRFIGLFEAYVRKTYTEGNSNGDGDLKLALTDTDRALAKARGEG